MVAQEDIRKASKLVNQLLYAKGYFIDHDTGTSEEETTTTKEQKLLYNSIDSSELEEIKDGVIENDKLNINIIYQLLTDLDQARDEIKAKNQLLKERDTTIQWKDRNIAELHADIAAKETELKEANQKDLTLSQNLKAMESTNKSYQRSLLDSKSTIVSLTAKKDLEIRKLQIQIDSLQDTVHMIHKRQKRISSLEITNNGIPVSTNTGVSSVNTELFDQETSKLVQGLTQLTRSSLVMSKDLTRQLDIAKVYLHILLTEKTPPTPKFFFENYQPSNPMLVSPNTNDLGSEIKKIAELKQATSEELIATLSKIHRFFQDQQLNGMFIGRASRVDDDGVTITSSNSTMNGKTKEVEDLQKQVRKLTDNLNSLYEINEKLKTRLTKSQL
ncbi:hypothetical protein WICPIJ_004470 [Wickerhamomyces pijperi]|uniref:Uncharacterized protein n=1 Tax=Wickerhamomyces pijperi TaxID=599730 RepID=A0A9P8Q7Y0_WICPI|nr:hypothetical protein WICPIJ_004470 [Wickerhamomyces pijperi]